MTYPSEFEIENSNENFENSKAGDTTGQDEFRYFNARSECLAEAMDLITGARAEAYGPPAENFKRIAVGWSVLLGVDVKPSQVALCMEWLKMARLVNSPKHWDSHVDSAAYAALAGELAKDE
jgi:hypothetical protein